METLPVKGHFLSILNEQIKVQISNRQRRTDVCAIDSLRRRLEPKTNILIPALRLGDDLLAYNVKIEETMLVD